MTFDILANLDQDSRWRGEPLPPSVLERISAAAALLAALAPDDAADVHVWAPGPVEPWRLCELPGWKPPHMHTGDRGAYNLTWANPLARAANDRRFALDVARELGCALHGARAIHSIAELDRHVALRGDEAWVCKAVWTTAGRDRVYGTGASYLRDQVERLIEGGPVVYEPWLERIFDVAVCGNVGERVFVHAPHGLMSSARGGFRGIRFDDTRLDVAEHDIVLMRAERVGLELQRAGYRGPFGVDAFVYRDGDARRLHPLCEINARYTFGHVARRLERRLGIASLHFGTSAPQGATMLINSTRSDPSCAWITSRA